MTARQILSRVIRNRRFWMVAGSSFAASILVRFLWHGAVGEIVSDAFFLGAAGAGGAFARAEAGLTQRGK